MAFTVNHIQHSCCYAASFIIFKGVGKQGGVGLIESIFGDQLSLPVVCCLRDYTIVAYNISCRLKDFVPIKQVEHG